MTRDRAPLWLAAPSRYARAPRGRAVAVLIVLILSIIASLGALTLADPGKPAAPAPMQQTDVGLYDAIVAGVRGGGNYYDVTADALRAGDYPLRPFVTFRLPTLAVAQASVPPLAVVLLQYALALAVMLAWGLRLRQAVSRAVPMVAALFLLGGGLVAFVQGGLAPFHEVWAAMLVALSLALYRPVRWGDAVLVALAAMLIRETAALYVLVMIGFALANGQRREALGWIAALGVFGIAVACHAWAVGQVTGPLDPASAGWRGLGGVGYFASIATKATVLAMVPMAVAAPLVIVALFGWSAWRSPLAGRVCATLTAYALLIAVFARVDTPYWALMVAPLLLVGLAFAPDGIRDLIASALDTRRVRVQRVTR